jgi:tRNA A-37 threonylcarbamoyl transferase component Bud32
MSEQQPISSETQRVRDTQVDVDLSGRQLGDYRLLRRLGRGGMAEVYLAEQSSLKRQVAFKVLKAELATNENYVKRFHQEAQAAASLIHASIVQIYEVGEIEGVHFIAQEYVQGKNLREYLDRNGALDVRLAVLIMRQVAAALYRAAQQGIVHRDIKPENVLIAASGEVKVADFGLARVVREGEALNLTQVGVTMGTPLYMSPEQAEGKPLDHRSDLYSLGVTCYHMLAGQAPFRGETALSLAVQHIKSPPEPLEKVRPDLPEALCRIVHRLLDKKPSNRYSSARELLRDLRMLPIEGLDELGSDDELWQVLGTELSEPLEATRRLDAVMKTVAIQRRLRPRRWAWLAGGVALALLAGAAASFASRGASLLQSTTAPHVDIPRQASAQAQFIYAGLSGTRAHWLSVINYQPHHELYARMANKELALLYLQENDYDAALRIFNELAELEEEQDFRTFGLAGQCVIDSLQGRHEEAIGRMAQFGPSLVPGRLDRRMSEALFPAMRSSYQKTSRKWEDWLEKAFTLEPEDERKPKSGKSDP